MSSIVGRTISDGADPYNTVAMSSIAGKSDLLQLSDRFRDLREELDKIGAMMAKSHQPDFELEDYEDLVRAQLYELAWDVADTSAETVSGLKLKAWIMSDRCNEDHADIIAALAQSICRDISHLLG